MDWRRIWGEFAATWKGVVLQPEEFFAAWDPAEPWEKVIVFNVICGLVGGVLTTVLTFFFGIEALIGYPVTVLAGTFVGGIVIFVCFKLLGGEGSIEETIKMVGYTQAVRVFYVGLPGLGFLMSTLASLYQVWLLVAGGRAVHRLDVSRATFAVLLPVAALGLLAFLVAVFLGVGVMGALMHLGGE